MTRELTGRDRPRNLPREQFFRRHTCARCGQHTDEVRFLPITQTFICSTDCTKEAK
jgi:hypothetical protein